MRKVLALVWVGLSCSALAQPAPAADAPPALRDFARFSDYSGLSLSPKGDYVAAKVRIDEREALAIIRLADRKMTAALNFSRDQSVGRYWWVGPDRVVASINTTSGSLAEPLYAGEMVGMNADGTGKAYLAGFRANSTTGTHIKPKREELRGWSYMVDPLPGSPSQAIIKADFWRDNPGRGAVVLTGQGRSIVYALNTLNGARTKIVAAPFEGHSSYLTDYQGRVRYVSGADVQGRPQAWYRSGNDEDWIQLETDAKVGGSGIRPLAFSPDDSKVYLSSKEGGDRTCLVEHVLASNERRALACDAEADLAEVIYSFDGGTRPIAAVFAAGKPVTVPISDSDPDWRLLRSLAISFPGQVVAPVSQSEDGGRLVLLVSSDRNPGDYYLFDTRSRKADYLLPRYSWIDPDHQSPMRAISFKARDGYTLHGFLTLPLGHPEKQLPLVMLPHGGPFGVRDEWGWNPDVQALASRGYAVLQVNFRGSAGYGEAFRDAGKRSWGTRMIDDITDGVRWAVAQGHADAQRLCIFGASYGGYAALMSAVREPDLYKCVVGYAGVYDLQAWKEDSIYKRSLTFFNEMVGESEDEMRAQSPITYLDKLRAAVLIVHGKEDTVAPYDQAKALRDALEERQHPHEWLAKADELHGFYDVDNREELYRRAIAFIDAHIGATAGVVAEKPEK